MARWLSCLHCCLTARRSWVRFPHGALLALGGRSPPDLQCSGGLSTGPFCVEFECSPRVHKGFPPLRTPTEKNMQKGQNTPVRLWPRWTVHLVPGRLQAAPGRSLSRKRNLWWILIVFCLYLCLFSYLHNVILHVFSVGVLTGGNLLWTRGDRKAREIAHLSTVHSREDLPPRANSAPCGNRTHDLLAVRRQCKQLSHRAYILYWPMYI